MSTLTPPATETSGRAAEPAPRLVDLLAAEWIKMRSIRSTYWVLALSALAAIAININAIHSDFHYLDQPHTAAGLRPFRYDPLHHSLSVVSVDLMTLASASFGAITVFGEYATGMIRTTFSAVPDRLAVMAAKVITVTAITFVLGLIVSTTSFFVTNAMLESRHVGLSINDAGCLRAVAAFAVVVPVCALVGMAFGAVLRHATASITGLVALLFLVPLLFGGDRYKLVKETGDYLPLNAENRLALNPHSATTLGKYPGTITGAWIALAVWATVALIVAIVVVRRRDV